MSDVTDFTVLQKSIVDADKELHTLEARRIDIVNELQTIYLELKVTSLEEARQKVASIKEKMKVAEEQIKEEARRLGLLSA